MTSFSMLAMSWTQFGLAFVLVSISLFMTLVILLQKGRGGGLAGAFGGAGGMSAFGAKTGDVFTWVTVVVAGIFVLVSVIANFAFDYSPKPVTATPAATTTVPVEQPGSTPIQPVTIDGTNVMPITIPPGGTVQPVDFQPFSPPIELPPAEAAGEEEKPKVEENAPTPENRN